MNSTRMLLPSWDLLSILEKPQALVHLPTSGSLVRMRCQVGTPGNFHKYNFSVTAGFFDLPAGTSSQPCVSSDTKGQPLYGEFSLLGAYFPSYMYRHRKQAQFFIRFFFFFIYKKTIFLSFSNPNAQSNQFLSFPSG